MKIRLNFFGIIFPAFFILFSSCTTEKTAEIKIIPKPLLLEIGTGTFKLSRKTSFVLADDNKTLFEGAKIFSQIINKSSSFVLEPEYRSEEIPEKHVILISVEENGEKYGTEGYSLNVTRDRIMIKAAKPAGAFYALQTLRQLFPPGLEDSLFISDSWSIPEVKIFDKPAFKWRGDLLDVSRHFLPLEVIRKNIDYLATYKMNVFHWHLTDDQGWRVQIKGYPELTEVGAWRVDYNDMPWWGRLAQKSGEKATYGGFYTQQEIKDLVKYAADRFVTIVPEIDMPGHSQATIASYPEVSCDGRPYKVATGGVASDNTICPGKEITFEFIERVLDEVLDLFPGEYFHIGGDECNKSQWKKCPDCQERIKKEGLQNEHELQSYFITRVEKIVNKHGKRLIGWDEILEGGLAPNATLMSWRGEKGGIAAAKMGHDVVMTPNTYCYLDLIQGDPELEPPLGYSQLLLSTVYSYDPIPKGLTEGEARHVLGVQGNLWGESIQNETDMNYMLFPRLLAVAEVGWTPKNKREWDDFTDRLEYNLLRLDNKGIDYAPSMYNVWVEGNWDEDKGGYRLIMKTEHGKVAIRYTMDGSDPTMQSELYDETLIIYESCVLKAAGFMNSGHGRITTKRLRIHKAAGLPLITEKTWNDRFPVENASMLTDCNRGSTDFKDGKWLAYEKVDFSAIIDLGRETPVTKVELGYLEQQRQFIFPPERVDVWLSADGINYTKAGSERIDVSLENTEIAIRTVEISFPSTKVRYVKIFAKNTGICPSGHKWAGRNAWMFLDEIFVE